MKLYYKIMYKWVYGNCRHVCALCKYKHNCDYDTLNLVSKYHKEKAERIRRRDLAYYKKWKAKRGDRK